MQGIFVDSRRPASKAAVKRALADDPNRVRLEATSLFGNEPDGYVPELPPGEYLFVGPDPYTSRKFYGSLVVDNARAASRRSSDERHEC